MCSTSETDTRHVDAMTKRLKSFIILYPFFNPHQPIIPPPISFLLPRCPQSHNIFSLFSNHHQIPSSISTLSSHFPSSSINLFLTISIIITNTTNNTIHTSTLPTNINQQLCSQSHLSTHTYHITPSHQHHRNPYHTIHSSHPPSPGHRISSISVRNYLRPMYRSIIHSIRPSTILSQSQSSYIPYIPSDQSQ